MNSLTHQTRIAIHLIVEDDSGQVAQFLTALTTLMGLFIETVHLMNPAAIWLSDFFEAVDFTLKVFCIGFTSLAFGLGVRI